MFEYLEKHCADAYKREFDQDENVIRSLPFFVAALTLELALLSQITIRLPPPALTWYAGILYALLAGAGLAYAATIVLMFLATLQRTFRYTPPESQVVDWAISQRKAYLSAGFPRAEVDEVVEEELQEQLAEEFAAAAEHNRTNNITRLRYRGYALGTLMLALLLALTMGTIIFGNHLVSKPGAGAIADGADTKDRSGEGQVGVQAASQYPDGANDPREAVGQDIGGPPPVGGRPVETVDPRRNPSEPTQGVKGVPEVPNGQSGHQAPLHPNPRQGEGK
ncbi:hypothetical protein [Brevundimonas sp. UBA7534]|uniref:hypothetical protein n=1 Tax=Brevundimonas sp. UBA7534 TaxID=1946138 RepID=UPI0025C53978|nr:hypothetical protein [Brevundimonas sp. UBA7534]